MGAATFPSLMIASSPGGRTACPVAGGWHRYGAVT